MPSVSSESNVIKIHRLPEELANQIAAGEVVERPASAVKELVENSIDAGADRILVEVESAGKTLIRVSDNGVGMSAEDAEMAFARHATSKISRQEDLEGIRTLGFRGEALPSIASISKVRLSTSRDENEGGTQVVVEGGTLREVKEAACPRGVTIEVAQLFYNTPARKKFLKGDTTEFSHITQVVTQQALAHPQIHFTLKHNGREILNTLPTDQPLYRIAEIFGAELVKSLVRVEAGQGGYRLEGFVSNPVHTRSNRSAQYCFVNGRLVRDKVILHATQQGYSHLLPKGEHPVMFLFLTMDPKLLDVNVHPTKAEVRFAFQQEVHRFVSRGIRDALSRNEGGASNLESAEEPLPKPGGSENISSVPRSGGHETRGGAGEMRYTRDHYPRLAQALTQMVSGSRPSSPSSSGQCLDPQMPMFDQKPTPVSDLIYSEFEPLGQLDQSFIILQGKKGMVVVDQHIAHERVLYERFRNAARNKRVEVQQLLFPVPVECSPAEAQLLTAHMDHLKELGVELELFGQNGFLVRSVPAFLKGDDHAQLIREIVEMLSREGQGETVKEKYEEILVMMACRNAIKVNHPLDLEQIRKLLSDLEQTEMPYTCPHGRPISLFFDMDDILKKFLRK